MIMRETTGREGTGLAGTVESGVNPWPWGLVAVLVVFVGFTGFLVYKASSQRVDLVSVDYYEREMKYDGEMKRQERGGRLGQEVSVALSADGRRLRIQIPASHANPRPAGRLLLSRPAESGLDRLLPLEVDASGVQEVDVSGMKLGLWTMRLVWMAQGEEYQVERRLNLPVGVVMPGGGRR